jgi:hypothetical protein
MSRAICDRLTVTVPCSHDAALRDVAADFAVTLDGLPGRVPGLWQLPGGGTFMYMSKSWGAALEASGQALAALRTVGHLADYLQALGSLPHRVSRLDSNIDLPIPAAPFLHDLYAKGRAGRIQFGRKALPGNLVRAIFSNALYPGEPLDTGTVYMPMKRDAHLTQYGLAYDKRQERIERGCPDPGPLLRLEAIAARGKGATLSDAWDPASLFYSIMSPTVITAPSGMSPWSPAEFVWEGSSRAAASPSVRLTRYLDGSAGRALLEVAGHASGIAEIRSWLDAVEKGRALAGGSGSSFAAQPAQPQRTASGHPITRAPDFSAQVPAEVPRPRPRRTSNPRAV